MDRKDYLAIVGIFLLFGLVLLTVWGIYSDGKQMAEENFVESEL